jgi:hypothetical protein
MHIRGQKEAIVALFLVEGKENTSRQGCSNRTLTALGQDLTPHNPLEVTEARQHLELILMSDLMPVSNLDHGGQVGRASS